MPTSSRFRELFGRGPLRGDVRNLLPGRPADGFGPLMENGLFGGHLSAAADAANARVRVDLSWPSVQVATVQRVHADGSVHPVRDGNPALVMSQWARWDYEAPFGQPVTYQATSTQATGALATTAAVTLDVDRDWLTCPTRPALNRPITIREFGARDRDITRGVLRPPDRESAIFVYGRRHKPAGLIVLQTDGTMADLESLIALLDAATDLMIRRPAVRGGQAWWISPDKTSEARLDPGHPTLLIERLPLPFEVVDAPAGEASGGNGDSYAAIAAVYPTYEHHKASGLTYLELSMLE